jgi:hypothetical protein
MGSSAKVSVTSTFTNDANPFRVVDDRAQHAIQTMVDRWDPKAAGKIIVYDDGKTQTVGDGWLRVLSARQARKQVAMDIRKGNRSDAAITFLTANADRNLPVSAEETRQAVFAILADPEKALWSNRRIAEAIGSTHPTVKNYRDEFAETTGVQIPSVRVGSDGRVINVAPINAGRTVTATDDDHYSNEWYTPVWIWERVNGFMGGVDMDPASCKTARDRLPKNLQPAKILTEQDNGLAHSWGTTQHPSRVFLNPPYGKDKDGNRLIEQFIKKTVTEYEAGRLYECVMLLAHYPCNNYWRMLDDYAQVIICERVEFDRPDGGHGRVDADHVLVYMGPRPGAFMKAFNSGGGVTGHLLRHAQTAKLAIAA